ncbi:MULTISPECIES: hypothetical protein [Meridianimaribacter]|uniref:Uncharacterized protein n=1 Tax=Meridianimaribacter flavus TaxID=571115 RepID=A0ABY2G2P5_9FLAO|nr:MULTISPECIES: hypothetical protein [Meridianimaribacter]TDY10538.1 hypothetical protein A8975_2264 [Meridianimaribacter flavus]
MKKLLFILISVVLTSCSEDDKSMDNTDNNLLSFNGEIILPPESSINVNSLTVSTSIDQTNVVDGEFQTKIGNDFTGIYVENELNETILMGYHYPNRPNNNIDANSTALALVMMSPSIVFLSENGKQDFIDSVLNDSNFTPLLQEIEENLLTNRPLFDQTNSELQNALTSLFQSASSRSANQEGIPVLVNSAGRLLSFSPGQGNLPNAYSTVISVLKDDVKIDELLVKGVQLVPNSVEDILSGNGGTFDDPVEVIYTLEGDGDFTFKFYTGKPGFGDGSTEHDKAFYENLGTFSNNLLLTLIPLLDNNDVACLSTIRNNILSTVQTISDVSSNSNAGIGTILYSANSTILNNLDGIVTCGTNSGININYSWFNKFIKQWNFINTAFNFISNGANTFNFSVQWAQTTSISECCYNAIGNDVQECGEIDLSGQWTLVQVSNYFANQYNSTQSCDESGNTTYGGFTYYGTPAIFSQNTFSLSVGFNQIFNFCSNNECADTNFCFNNPNQLLLAGNYNSNGNNTYTYSTSNGGGQIYVVNENTINIASTLGTLVYIR